MKPHFFLPRPLNFLLLSHARCTVIAGILAAICYWNSFQGGLVHDDIFAVRDNADVRPETPLAQVFSNDFWGKPMSSNVSHKSYRPLTVLSFRVNYALHGLDPFGYHTTNVGLHVMVVALLGWLCRRVVFTEPDLVFLVMCLFASHPVHTEAVTGVVGRAELLTCLCFLLSFLSYTTSLTTTSTSWRRPALGVCGCVVMGTAAMLFKENGATVFGVCLAYDVLIYSRSTLWRSLVQRRSPLIPSLSPLLLRSTVLITSATVLLIFRISLLHGLLPQFSAHDNPASHSPHLLTRSLTYSYLFFFNTRLLVMPLTLCYDWQMGSIPLVERLTDVRNIGTGLFYLYLVGLAVALLWRSHFSRGYKTVVLSLLVMVVPFLPASNLLVRIGFVVAERILYIPSIGYCILLVYGVKTLSSRLHLLPSPPLHKSPLLFFACLLLITLFSVRTVVRNPVWHTRETLFRSGLATVPHNAKIHYNYANYLRDSGRAEEAIHHYREAIRLAPDHVSSHNNLGSLPEIGAKEAEFHFRQAVHYSPSHYRALYNLGKNLVHQGRLAEAEEMLRESLKVNEDYHGTLMTLATLLSDTGRAEEGLHHMQRAVEVAPQDTLVRNNMAAFLLRQGKTKEAINEFHLTLSLDSHNTFAMSNLARAYRSHGDNANAEQWFLKSLSLEEDVTTYNSLGALYFNTGRYQEAKVTFLRALALDPAHMEARCSYCQSLIHLNQREAATTEALSALHHLSNAPNTNTACLHLILATVYAQKKEKLQEAHSHATSALESTDVKSKAEAYYIRAGILKEMDELDRAEENYRQAIALFPTMVNAHMNLGALLHIQKNYVEARRYYEKALTLDPGNKMVADNLAKLERLEQQTLHNI